MVEMNCDRRKNAICMHDLQPIRLSTIITIIIVILVSILLIATSASV